MSIDIKDAIRRRRQAFDMWGEYQNKLVSVLCGKPLWWVRIQRARDEAERMWTTITFD